MCGLVALYRRGGEPVGESEVVAMRDLLVHRGPDGAGLLIDGSVGLGFRRLRVIDLAGGHQPMASPCGQAHVVFNGEIYNYRSLRRLLASRGVTLRTESDTETILGLYELFGPRCVEHLHGMFAFVIWDRGRRRLVAARDRMGIKPLYLLRRGQTIALASEIKAFLPLAEWTPRLDEERLPEYLVYRGLAGGASLFAGVEQLAPGELLVATPEGLRRELYWRLPQPRVPGVTAAPRQERSDLQWAEELDALLQEVVSDHLVSDVPLGTFNSGGVDSSLTTALAARARSEPLHTYSVGFAEAAFDESRYAQAVAGRFGTNHHQLFAVEREATDQGADFEERRIRREKVSRATLDAFRLWIEEMAQQALPKSALAAAIGYTQRQWAALERYLGDGELVPDNSASERRSQGRRYRGERSQVEEGCAVRAGVKVVLRVYGVRKPVAWRRIGRQPTTVSHAAAGGAIYGNR